MKDVGKNMKKTMASQPLYFKRFICTCDKCVYNCCRHNWQINIDKNTYNKYKKLNKIVGKEFLDKINVVTKDPFNAIIITNKDGICHFLDEKGFCSIQLSLGYDYLSRTCRIHPRSISYIDGVFETFLELSCEEAARVVLFDEEPMMFEQAVLEPDGSGNIIPNRMLTADKYTSVKNGVELFSKLRITSTEIVQSRKYPLRVRMLLLCILIEQVDQLFLANKDSDAFKAADESLVLISTGVYDSIAEQMPDGIDIDFALVLDILRDMSRKDDERFYSILERSLTGHGISFDTFELSDAFIDGYREAYNKFFADREYIFEKYIVNHIFMEGFPFNFGKEGGVMANFADLLAKYNLIEFLLVGVCKFYGTFDEWNIINCVSAFGRRYDHSSKGYLMMG